MKTFAALLLAASTFACSDAFCVGPASGEADLVQAFRQMRDMAAEFREAREARMEAALPEILRRERVRQEKITERIKAHLESSKKMDVSGIEFQKGGKDAKGSSSLSEIWYARTPGFICEVDILLEDEEVDAQALPREFIQATCLPRLK